MKPMIVQPAKLGVSRLILGTMFLGTGLVTAVLSVVAYMTENKNLMEAPLFALGFAAAGIFFGAVLLFLKSTAVLDKAQGHIHIRSSFGPIKSDKSYQLEGYERVVLRKRTARPQNHTYTFFDVQLAGTGTLVLLSSEEQVLSERVASEVSDYLAFPLENNLL